MTIAFTSVKKPLIRTLSRLFNWFIIAIVCLTLVHTVKAHEIKPAIVNLTYTGIESSQTQIGLTADIVVNLESLISEIGPGHEDTDTSENSEKYQALRALESRKLEQSFKQYESIFLNGILITNANGDPYTIEVKSVVIPTIGDTKLPRDTNITLAIGKDSHVSNARFQWLDKFGTAIVRANSDLIALTYSTLLSPGQASDLIQFTEHSIQSSTSIFSNYIVVGFEHILPKGLDHILFVIGLFLLSPAWRPLLLQATIFTVAHSITLALGATEILRIPSSIVEPLIALSIVFVCAENFMTNRLNKWRIVIVFLFGLLHGLGFAGILDSVVSDNSHFITALLGFNVGVELGQLTIITICLACIGLSIGSKPWYRSRFSKPASLIIGLIGAFWFLERVGWA